MPPPPVVDGEDALSIMVLFGTRIHDWIPRIDATHRTTRLSGSFYVTGVDPQLLNAVNEVPGLAKKPIKETPNVDLDMIWSI